MKEILCFLFIPIITSIYYIKYLDGISSVVTLILYISINFGISILLYRIFTLIYNIRKIKHSEIMSIIVGLISIDQIIKMYIDYLDMKPIVFNNIIGIKPTHNKEQMAILNLLRVQWSDEIIIVTKLLMVLLIIFIFIKIKHKNKNIFLAFILLEASSISNLFDSIFWGYTVDYILFYGFTCYDLKDFYVDTGLGLLLLENIKWIIKDN